MINDEMKQEIRQYVDQILEEKDSVQIKETNPVLLYFENGNIQSLCVTVVQIDNQNIKIVVSPRTNADKEGQILVVPNTVVELAKIA